MKFIPKLIKLSFILSACFAVAVSFAVFVGSKQSITKGIKGLRLTDCTPPCWIGLKPGITQEDAEKRFYSAFDEEQGYNVIFALGEYSDIFAVIVEHHYDPARNNPFKISDDVKTSRRGYLKFITIDSTFTDFKSVSLMELLAFLGTPSIVYLHEARNGFWNASLVFSQQPGIVLDINRIENRITPSDNASITFGDINSPGVPTAWRGFTTIDNMLRHRLEN